MRPHRTSTSSSAWRLSRAAAVVLSLVMTMLTAVPASAQEDDCLKCHKALANVKDGHAGLKAGCKTCHAATDASTVPHKTTGNVASGLSASQPELCVACHDKPKFTKTNRHSAPAKGCTGCHTAHVSKEEKLLKSEVPGLCYSCHDESLFKAKFRHRPVARGACLDCHDAHSTEHPVMLITGIEVICLECHSEVKEQPHLVAGFSSKGHPLGDEKGTTPAADPLRPDKRFYCGSCHHPHKADFPKLNRLDPNATTFCLRCHEK